MNKSEFEKYADLVMSMSLDFKTGKITAKHYANCLSMCTDAMVKMVADEK